MQNLFFTIIILLFTIQPPHKANYRPVTVLELFTSQGCSSCPPADNLLNQVKKEHSDRVIVLSYHVDYWNYIGWKDPFSKKTFSNKQRAYGNKFYSSSIYTPQVVVNGKEHFVGSNKSIMNAKLKHYSKYYSENGIDLQVIKKNSESVSLNYNVKGEIAEKQLRVALVIDHRETSVNRGENRNRVLSNSNIVVEEMYVDLEKATGGVTVSIPDLVTKNDKLSVVALIENKALDIVGGSQTYL